MKNVKRILFVGNSITRHAPAPELGWYGDWGMAASSRDTDYVHHMIGQIKEYNSQTEFMFRNIAEYERNFWDFELDKFKDIRDFNADIIIMRIAENVNDKEAGERGFEKYYNELIKYFNVSGNATIFCTNSFWPNKNVNMQIKKAADQNNYVFVDISMLYYDEENMAKKEFENEGVGLHPSDKGMENIANIISGSIKEHLPI